jgi:uncharacterized protein (TIGR04222 family)
VNPFDLSGPEFLLFYLVLGALVTIGVVLLRRSAESGPPIPGGVADPYLIATLRGGSKETLTVAVMTLIDSGLLRVEADGLVAAGPDAVVKARRPLEKAILERFATSSDERSLPGDPAVAAAVSKYEDSLRQMGALPGPEVIRARILRFLSALLLLWGVAAAKIVIALGRKRYNIEFLVILALLFAFAVALVSFPRRTARGDALLTDLRTLFSPLRQRIGTLKHGLEHNEFALLAGAFGLPLLAAANFGSAYRPFHKRTSASGCGYSCGSTGSSCGSGGSSCGSSCGGGGCGGGCGGCGGG